MFAYEILIRFYYCAICIASFFSPKAKKWIKGRRDWRKHLLSIDYSQDQWVWFHCSSFGEFQDGKCLIEEFRICYPQYKILLTFFSPSGFEIQKNYSVADKICYLPLDTKANAKFLIGTINPLAVFFVRNDIWANYITEISARKISVFLTSFILSSKSNFLKFPQRYFYKNVFRKFTTIFVQNISTRKILLENSFSENVLVAGNSRTDRVLDICKENFKQDVIEKFIDDKFCVIAGSTHIKDREIYIKVFLNLHQENIKWIIVPHEIDRDEIANAKKVLSEKMICLSEIKDLDNKVRLLWIDDVGQLAKIYRYADIVFVGGGFQKQGIHNILEPAVYGCPVCFGPNHRSYTEAMDLLSSGNAAIVQNENDLQRFILKYKNDAKLLKKSKAEIRNYVLQDSGATDKILKHLQEKKYFN